VVVAAVVVVVAVVVFQNKSRQLSIKYPKISF
jgi:hypothetical protein